MKRYEVVVKRLVVERWIVDAVTVEHAEHDAVNRRGKLDAGHEEIQEIRATELWPTRED